MDLKEFGLGGSDVRVSYEVAVKLLAGAGRSTSKRAHSQHLSTCPLSVLAAERLAFPGARHPRRGKMGSVFYDLYSEITLCHYFCILCVR